MCRHIWITGLLNTFEQMGIWSSTHHRIVTSVTCCLPRVVFLNVYNNPFLLKRLLIVMTMVKHCDTFQEFSRDPESEDGDHDDVMAAPPQK